MAAENVQFVKMKQIWPEHAEWSFSSKSLWLGSHFNVGSLKIGFKINFQQLIPYNFVTD
jgi:hypothetical protein